MPAMGSRDVWLFPAAILVAGTIRFALTVLGVPNAIAKYSSMSAVILAGCIYFGMRAKFYREIAKYAYVLIVPYMLIVLVGIGYTWATGRDTIFHAPEYSFNSPVHVHFWGHLIGGLTWEPAALFILMAIVRLLCLGWRRMRAPMP
jgi:hypothetical protein